SVSFEFRAETLKHFNPLPHVLQLLLEVHDLRARGGALYTVLAELYSNALEHGVIGLDSTMKSDAAGFARYYQERVSRLQALRDGYVRLHLDLAPHGAGGRLLVRVEDSGEGFDVERALNAVERQERLCGRGLRLIRELSDRCQWSADGKVVSVEFFWSPQA
ncbi:MAG: two-component system response regulator HsbR, partial [Pseudomonas aeruginosa]|nr:two-component system response regulator HsbR [Pseudomonas aeruginosa]